MRRYILYFRLAVAALTAAVFRIFRGPKRPGWTFRFEILVAVLREAITRTGLSAVSGDSKRRLATRVPRSIASELTVESTTFAGLPIDIHTPRAWKRGAPTILYLHGGAYIACSPGTHRELVARIAVVSGARCVVPDYRLAPRHPFPAAVDDTLSVYRGLLADGVDPTTIFLAGDSAGGGLSLAALLSLRDAGAPMPRGAVLLSPWVDLAGTGESLLTNRTYDYLGGDTVATARLYAKDTDLSHPLVSPIYADLSGLPPLLVQSGDAEMLFSQNQRLVERARAAGVVVEHEIEPGMVHVYQCFAAFSPQGKAAIVSIGRFVRSLAGTGETRAEEAVMAAVQAVTVGA
ncbi:MAG TPA: alpha/beta hydrolase [Polyangiaceae bacterium]|nr:alpha/beta hydrolase [Polyangiaceae bacterium]